MQEVAILEKFLYLNIISTGMRVFNAMRVINTIQASFPDIIPVLKSVEKGDWHRRRELKRLRKKSKRRVRKRDVPFRKARALLTLGHGKVAGRALGARRKAGCCGLCHLLLTVGDGLEIRGCRNSLFYVRQMLDVCLIQKNTSGIEGNRGFMQAAKYLSIFMRSLQRETPLLHPWSTPVPGRLFIQDCRRGKEECFAGMQMTLPMTGPTFLTCYQ